MNITTRIKRAWRALRKNEAAPKLRHALVSSWQEGVPAPWVDDPTEQIKHFKHWVYAAVSAIAFRTAASDLRLFVRRGPRDMEELDEHPFLDLVSHVNPFHTKFWLWSMTSTFLELTGNAYWYVVRNKLGTPAEIWMVHSQYMRVVPDRENFIGGYEYRRGPHVIKFDRDEIIHLKYPNPQSLFYGAGPLQAAAEAVDTHEFIRKAEWASFKNGIFPSLALSAPQQLSDTTINRLEKKILDRYGSTDNAGKVMILEQGLEAKPISLTPREMDFIRSSKMTRNEILGIFKVPPAVAGLSEDVNRAVAEAMDIIFAKYCIWPKLKLIQDQLNQDLLPLFDDKLHCEFDSPVPEDREARRAEMEANLAGGVTTINEERAKQGLGSVPWGDKPLVIAN